eukprot:523295_1
MAGPSGCTCIVQKCVSDFTRVHVVPGSQIVQVNDKWFFADDKFEEILNIMKQAAEKPSLVVFRKLDHIENFKIGDIVDVNPNDEGWRKGEIIFISKKVQITYNKNGHDILYWAHPTKEIGPYQTHSYPEKKENEETIASLEFAITAADNPLLPELSALGQLLEKSCDRDIVSLVLKTIRNIVLRKPHFKSAFLQTGVVDVLMDHIVTLSQHVYIKNNNNGIIDESVSIMSSDGDRRNDIDDISSNLNRSFNRDLRVWSLSDVINWFSNINNGKYKDKYTSILSKLDFNGQKLLSTEEETLRLELQIGDENERKE